MVPRHKIRYFKQNCKTANATTLQLLAEVELVVRFEDGERMVVFWVAKDLSTSLVLGYPFLRKYKAVLDFNSGKLILNYTSDLVVV